MKCHLAAGVLGNVFEVIADLGRTFAKFGFARKVGVQNENESAGLGARDDVTTLF